MARKRMIDPDSWTDEKLADLSIGAHLLWVGLVSLADDEGRLEWRARQFKFRLFAAKPEATIEAIEGWMREIVQAGAIIVYESEGDQYAHHPKWAKHQYVNKPTKSKLPIPPTAGPLTDAARGTGTERESSRKPPEKHRNTTGILPEYSLRRIGEVLELPVALESVLESESESESDGESPAGAGEPRRGEPCLCERSRIRPIDHSPETLAPVFLATFANQRSEKSRRSALGTWTGWLREMRIAYPWPAIWDAFVLAHRDVKHAPLRGSAPMWSNLRAVNGRPPLGAVPRTIHAYSDGRKVEFVRGGSDEPKAWSDTPPLGLKRADVWPEHRHMVLDDAS